METILIVEDDRAVQKALKRLFESEGYEVDIQGDGKSALEAYRKVGPTAIVLDHKATKDADDSMSKATVWCIWDSKQKKVIHISTGYAHGPLGIYDPPVNFEDFFPIPRPLFATTATDSTVPVPDLDQYQDQVDEIDMYTQRIFVLGKSLKVRGLYPGDMESVKQAMDDATDATLIPIPNWAMLGERGGGKNLIAWFPVDMIRICDSDQRTREPHSG